MSAPLQEEVLVCLSAEMGDPWLQDIRIRLIDPPDSSDNLFLVCRDGSGQIVSNTWIGWDGGQPPGERIGLLGYVVTLLLHRRKGLATRVVELAMEEFYKSGGLCLTLGVADQSAHRIYHRTGFRVVHGRLEERHSIILHSRHSTPPHVFLSNYFTHSADQSSHTVTRNHIAELCLLFLHTKQPINDELFQIGDPQSAQMDCLKMFLLQDSYQLTAKVLLSRSRVVGLEIDLGDKKYSIYSNK